MIIEVSTDFNSSHFPNLWYLILKRKRFCVYLNAYYIIVVFFIDCEILIKYTKYQKKSCENSISTQEKRIFEVPPRFELGSLDSKSRVLTITPWDPVLPVTSHQWYTNPALRVNKKTLFTWRWEWYCTFLRLCKRQLLWMIHSCISSYNSCVKFDESGPEFFKNFIVPLKTC